MKRGFLGFVVLLVLAALCAYASESRIRVTVEKANIRLKPFQQSVAVSTVPLGGMLEVIKKEGEWFLVKLPPDAKGIVIIGYIHQSVVELAEEIAPPVQSVNKVEQLEALEKTAVNNPEQSLPPSLKGKPLSEKEKHFLKTDPYYFTWRDNLDRARAKRGSAKKWLWIGGGAMVVGYIAMPLLAVSSLNDSSSGKSQNKMTNIGVIIGMAGTTTFTYGLISYFVKGKKVSRIAEEGILKGYIMGLNINPAKKQYGIMVSYTF